MKLATGIVAAALMISTVVAVGSAVAAPASQIKDAQAYIKKHGTDANRVQANVVLAQLAIGQVSKNGTQANLNKLALTAQDSHDNLDAIRNNFAESASGGLGDAELLVFAGANDLKNSMGALVAWTGNPNAATLASFASQFKRGRSEWDSGIRKIWKLAQRSKPPII